VGSAAQLLIEALLMLLAEELAQRYPALPLAWVQQFARQLAAVLVQWANDPVQREAEVRAVYAHIEALLQGEEQQV
jgi:hypothetical protein